jgi:hypothetical protein
MKLNAHSFGSAGGITIGICYTGIALCLKIWPYETLRFISTSLMIPRLENITPYIKMSFEGIFIGLAVHILIGYLFFGFFAFLYNLFSITKS